MYRTYDPHNPETVMKMRREANYKLRVQNFTSKPVTEFSVYFPIPKKGQDWGNTINPEGEFQYDTVHAASAGLRLYLGQKDTTPPEIKMWADEEE